MYYYKTISIPGSTPETTPVVSHIDGIPERTIQACQVDFVSVTNGLVGVRFLDRNREIIPSMNSPTKWLIGEGMITALPDDVTLNGSPYRVTIEAYNTNATAVTVQVRLVVVTMTIQQAIFGLLNLVSAAVDRFISTPKEASK